MNFFKWLYDFFTVDLWVWLKEFGTWLVNSFLTTIYKIAAGAIDIMIAAVEQKFAGVDILENIRQAWESIPPEFLMILTLLNFQAAFYIIICAYIVKTIISVFRSALPAI